MGQVLLEEGRLAERVKGSDGHSRRRGGEAMKIGFGLTCLLYIEPRQPDDDRSDIDEGEDPTPDAVFQEEKVEDEGRCDAEADGVHERIELFTEIASRAGEACDSAVHHVY